MSSCQQCSCKNFQANRFKPLYCSICLHNHTQKTSSLQQLVHNDAVAKPNTTTPPVTSTQPKLAKSYSFSGSSPQSPQPSSSLSTSTKAAPPPTPPKTTSSTSISTKDRPKAQDFSKNKPAASTSKSSKSKSNSSSSNSNNNSNSSLKTKFAGWKGAIQGKVNNLMGDGSGGSDDSSRSGDAVMEISGPTDYKHNTHIGITSTGAIETNNIPDEWKEIFRQVDQALKSLGKKGVSRKEAALILNAVLAGQAPAGTKSLRSTPGTPPSLPPKPTSPSTVQTQSTVNLNKSTPSNTSATSFTSSLSTSSQATAVKPKPLIPTTPPPSLPKHQSNASLTTSTSTTSSANSTPNKASPMISSTNNTISVFEHEQLKDKLRQSEQRLKSLEQSAKTNNVSQFEHDQLKDKLRETETRLK
ncbi:hypothetical protein SAMD00019534_126320, partial [Acytostelium subglobosum LB1]